MPPRISWLNEHIETFLDTLLAQKAGFGQGGNPQAKHIQAAVDAVNIKFGGTQNTKKLLRSAQDKWRTVSIVSSAIHLLTFDLAQVSVLGVDGMELPQRPELR